MRIKVAVGGEREKDGEQVDIDREYFDLVKADLRAGRSGH